MFLLLCIFNVIGKKNTGWYGIHVTFMLALRQKAIKCLQVKFSAGCLYTKYMCIFCLFVCVEVLRPSQPNRVMSSAVSFPNHTFTGQA